jgi:hypothetical protein
MVTDETLYSHIQIKQSQYIESHISETISTILQGSVGRERVPMAIENGISEYRKTVLSATDPETKAHKIYTLLQSQNVTLAYKNMQIFPHKMAPIEFDHKVWMYRRQLNTQSEEPKYFFINKQDNQDKLKLSLAEFIEKTLVPTQRQSFVQQLKKTIHL